MTKRAHWGMSILILFVSLSSLVASLSAMGQESNVDLNIVATNCERAPTAFPFQGGDCVPAGGTVIVVTTMTGNLIGTCVSEVANPTDVVAGCAVSVPLGSTVIVTEDTTKVPAGYAPTNNPQTIDVPSTAPDGIVGGPVFLNLPAEGDHSDESIIGSAGNGRTLTILSALCPPGYTGMAAADECDSSPLRDVGFRIGHSVTGDFTDYVLTDDEGLVSFEFDQMQVDGTLRIIEELPSGTDRIAVYCVNEDGRSLDIAYASQAATDQGIGVVDVSVEWEGDVACDWYNVPESDRAAGERIDEVHIIGDPRWWIVPFADGWGNTEEGNLYFGTLVTNPTSATVAVGASFRAYDSDGTSFPGCHMPTGDGPGVTTTIAPGETAILMCHRSIVPVTLEGLQVTARLWDGDPIVTAPASVDIQETQLLPDPTLSSPMETSFDASAIVSTTGTIDTEVELIFRFYDGAGIQIGTCESFPVIVEPEVAQRVNCASPILLDVIGPQPVRVEAEAFHPD